MPAVRHSLDPIFRPRSVAVFGASAAPGSVGAILMHNLLANPFGGAVYPVNPKRRTVLGVHCYPDLASVPEAVDMAVIATPASDRAGPGRRLRRPRRAGRDRHLGRLLRTRRRGPRPGGSHPRRPRPDAPHRPQLSRRHPPAQQPQRQFRRGDGPARPRCPPEPKRRHLHRHPRLGARTPHRLQQLRQRWLDARRGLRRPARLLRRRPGNARRGAVHGVDRRCAPVPQRRP